MNARRILSSVLALFLLTGITVHISVVAQSSDSGGSTSQRLDYTDIGSTELDGGCRRSGLACGPSATG